jgi:hypothetical protein
MRSTERRPWRHHFPFAAVHSVRAAVLLLLLAAVTSPTPVHAQGEELIVDGRFEQNGNGWFVSGTFTSSAAGGWFLSPVGNITPLFGLPTDADGGATGTFAITDQHPTVAGTTALYQTFTVPANPGMDSLLLSFDMFVNDWSSQTTYNASQHARVDIVNAQGAANSVHLAASLFNAYLGTDGGPLPNEFRHYEFDILPFLTPGTQYRLRFQITKGVTSQVSAGVSEVQLGVDNVSILAVPEPGTLVLFATGIAFVSSVVMPRHKRKRA